jgi:hypothetical protein
MAQQIVLSISIRFLQQNNGHNKKTVSQTYVQLTVKCLVEPEALRKVYFSSQNMRF